MVYGERAATYGHPRDNFWNIATLWSAYFGEAFSAEDVAIMMILVKIARLGTTPNHRDSWVDIAGYAGAAARALDIDD